MGSLTGNAEFNGRGARAAMTVPGGLAYMLLLGDGNDSTVIPIPSPIIFSVF